MIASPDNLLPVFTLASSFIPGLIIFFLDESRENLRVFLNMAGATIKLVFVGIMLWGVTQGYEYRFSHRVVPGLELVLQVDALALLFVTLSAVLWFLTTLYAIGYLQHSADRNRFFGFFSLCVTTTVGIALAGNLFTFFFFYELLTLATYPLVVHRGNAASLHAGNRYLAYTLGGGALLLVGTVWLYALCGTVDFTHTGNAARAGPEAATQLRIIFLFLIAGLGVKASLIPLHGWLPSAMVAPAPVSALLHAVAVVKAGAFGVVRVLYEVYGIEVAHGLGLLLPLALLASATILWGSLRALFQDDLKRRLAYSTVSQVSYIVLGVALFGPLGTIGGLAHLIHQGIMKVTMFFCAGNYAETLGIHKVTELDGVGARMPWNTLAFTCAALGMIGVPPMAGFISKWYLGLGALDSGAGWALALLAVSSLLNAAYFLPILYRAWFKHPAAPFENLIPRRGRWETSRLLLIPPLATAVMTVAAGLFAAYPISPLGWAQLIVSLQYHGL
ncbi:MAG TPA: proton-conducting transporter membrane subunit [Noviherbaspirillum sp.]|nr:proton-conducting transporter membrane subunit [Noviherbaspirillum sp.]